MNAPLRIRRPGIGVRAASAPAGEELNAYLDRLMKMIPGEAVGLYLVGLGFVDKDNCAGLALWALVGLVAVIVVRVKGTADPAGGLGPDWAHTVISAVAFVIWVYTMGGPFLACRDIVPYSQRIGSLIVLVWTFFAPLLYKGPAA